MTSPATAQASPLRGRLFRKYAGTAIALVISALIVVGTVQIWFTHQDNLAALATLQQEKADAAASEINHFIADIKSQAGWLTHARLYDGPNGVANRQIDFVRLLRQLAPVSELTLLDAAGKERLFMSRTEPDRVEGGQSREQSPEFRVAQGQGSWISPVYFRKQSEPYLKLAIAERGDGQGVIVAEINLKFVWDVVASMLMGESGTAYVVDANGRLIAHPDIGLVLRLTDLSHLPHVAAFIAGEPLAELVKATDAEGREVLSAASSIGSLNWLVLVELPIDEAYAPLRASLWRMAVLTLGGVVIAALAGLMLARRVTRPISHLQAAVNRLGQGDLGERVAISTGDELEALAEHFNRMAARLQDSYASLEEKVAARTRDLAQKNGELEQLSSKLAKYLSPQVYRSIFAGTNQVELASRRKKLTVLFSDIAGFAELTDKMESEDLTRLINRYLSEMSEVALAHGATIDKYIGDAVMIFFGDPETKGTREDALACARMAIAMQERMRELAALWGDSGIEQPLACRIGIHTGYCTVGNFGSPNRYDYTIIGGAVNLASRLEHEADPGGILISYQTQALIKDEIACEEAGQIKVKGIAYPVTVYRVLGLRANQPAARQPVRAELPHLKLQADPYAMPSDERRQAAKLLRRVLERLG